MPKNIHTPRDELLCGKMDKALIRAKNHGDIELVDLLCDILNDANRMEAKLFARRTEVAAQQSATEQMRGMELGFVRIERVLRAHGILKLKLEGTPDEVINAIVKSIDSALGDTEQMKPLVEAAYREGHADGGRPKASTSNIERDWETSDTYEALATMEQQEKKNG